MVLKSKCTARPDGAGHNSTYLETAAISSLKIRPGEPRRYPNADVDRAVGVLRQQPVGAPYPVIVNEDHEILVGGLFVEAARALGLTHMLVIVHVGLSEIQQKQFSIAVNQLLTRGEWDPAALKLWIRDLETELPDFSHLTIGFSSGELDRILGLGDEIGERASDADAVPPVLARAVSKPGAIWQAGRHHVMVGNATNPDHMKRLMSGSAAKLVITDPPFGCPVDGFVSKKGLHRDFVQGAGEMSRDELAAFFLKFMTNLAQQLQKVALVYIFIDWRSLDLMLRAGEQVFGSLLQLCDSDNSRPCFAQALRQGPMSLDTASKANEHNSYSALTVWRVLDGRFYLEFAWRDRVDYPTLKRRVTSFAEVLNPQILLIEDKVAGTGLIQDLQDDGVYPVVPYEPKGDKESRMRWQAAKIESGLVSLPKEASWLAAFEDEVRQFPGGKHNDQVDSMSQALDQVTRRVPDLIVSTYRS